MFVKHHKPRLYKTKTETSETDHYKRVSRTHTVDTLKDETLVVPIAAMINPVGLYELCKLSSSAVRVGIILTTYLNGKEQQNIVSVSHSSLAKFCNISIRSVVSAIEELTESGLVTITGKQKYRLSPLLAWFGSQVDWAVALSPIYTDRQKRGQDVFEIDHAAELINLSR
ncbi:MAG: hypothetical protein WC967_13525 [Balneolaceae bacterium]